jgi:hypothetical protein
VIATQQLQQQCQKVTRVLDLESNIVTAFGFDICA